MTPFDAGTVSTWLSSRQPYKGSSKGTKLHLYARAPLARQKLRKEEGLYYANTYDDYCVFGEGS